MPIVLPFLSGKPVIQTSSPFRMHHPWSTSRVA